MKNLTQKFVAALISLSILGGATTAMASMDDNYTKKAPSGVNALSIEKITQILTRQGFKVREVEWDHDGYYEAEVTDKNGKRLELELDPKTGEVLKSKIDD